MTENGEESIARMGDSLRITRDGFSKSLINRLIESSDIFNGTRIDYLGLSAPQSQDGRADRAILCGQLNQVKANKLSQRAVRRCRSLVLRGSCQTLRLDMSLVLCLRLPQVHRDGK